VFEDLRHATDKALLARFSVARSLRLIEWGLFGLAIVSVSLWPVPAVVILAVAWMIVLAHRIDGDRVLAAMLLSLAFAALYIFVLTPV